MKRKVVAASDFKLPDKIDFGSWYDIFFDCFPDFPQDGINLLLNINGNSYDTLNDASRALSGQDLDAEYLGICGVFE